MKQATELRARRDQYPVDRIADAAAPRSPRYRTHRQFDIHIRQIHVRWICGLPESRHLAAREPIVLTKVAMGGGPRSPPTRQGAVEDPRSDAFGCTPVTGQRRGARDVEKAQAGKFWLWPMHHGENARPAASMSRGKLLPRWPALNQGREIRRAAAWPAIVMRIDRDNDEISW
jgi:hypothetical protein